MRGEAGRSSSKGGNNQERSDPTAGVNNVDGGERIRPQCDAAPQGVKDRWAACLSGVLAIATAEWLKSSKPRHREVANGKGDSAVREDGAATAERSL